MTADIFTALQAFPQTQTLQQTTAENSSAETAVQPGLFASLMNECIADAETPEIPVQMFVLPDNSTEPQMTAFTGSNSFPQSVMNILAGEPEILPETESPEAMPVPENVLPSPEIPDDDDIVIWPEDEAPSKAEEVPAESELPAQKTVKDSAPEPELADDNILPEALEPAHADDTLPEVPEPARAEDTLPEVSEPAHAEDIPIKVQDSPSKQVKVFDGTEDSHESEKAGGTEDSHDEPEKAAEIPEGSVELAGLAGITTSQPQISEHPENPDTQTQPEKSTVFSQPVRQRRTQPETQQLSHEQQKAPESQEVSTNFRETLVNRNTDSENSGQDSQQEPQSQNQNHSQPQPQTQSRKTESISRKTDTLPQKPETSTQKTESHSDFAAYFEGVLNSRHTTARTSQPMPLNLRTAENFTQASALRDGITNVVRFIRADGVQKARVIVDPPALGRISVELTSGTSGVEASIKVASEQIRQLVQDQISQLRMNLSQQGVQLAEFTVDVQQDNSGHNGQQGQQQNTGRFGFFDDSEDDEAEDFRIDLEEGLLYWVA